jgi:putative Mn2+ efflux pump MntP
MDANRVLRFLAAVLALLSGILHLVGGLFLSGLDVVTLAVGVGFGVALVIIGVGLFIGKRLFYYLGIIIPMIGGIIGTYSYITTQVQTLPFVVMDVIVILCCAYLLFHRKA